MNYKAAEKLLIGSQAKPAWLFNYAFFEVPNILFTPVMLYGGIIVGFSNYHIYNELP